MFTWPLPITVSNNKQCRCTPELLKRARDPYWSVTQTKMSALEMINAKSTHNE